MNADIVMAYGDHGLEPTPADEAVTIEFFPLGPSNRVIPATLRVLASHSGGLPTKLTRVRRDQNGAAAVYVEFECSPFVRYTTEAGPVYGRKNGCWVFSETQAADQLFEPLTDRERARIMRTFRNILGANA